MKSNKPIFILDLLAVLFITVYINPNNVSAQGKFSNLFNLINSNLLGPKFQSTNGLVSVIINLLLPWTFVLGGLILLFMIIAGGFQILTAIQNPDQAEAGKAKIGAAAVGFLLLFSSYWLAQILYVLSGIRILGF